MQVDSKSSWKSLGDKLCQALTKALGSACTSPWDTVIADEPFGLRPTGDAAVSFRFLFEGPLKGELFLLIKKVEAVTLGLQGVGAEIFEDAHEAGLLGALEGCSTCLGEFLEEYGAVTSRVELLQNPELPEDYELELWARDGETRVSFYLCLSRALVTSLQIASARTLPYSDPVAVKEAPAANLDLVLDVELNVTLRFGQRQLSLREVMDLASGSVVELDRQVDEPVDLILDGRVVARGEAVIIDGNYGMRITQVIQPHLRS